MNDFGIYVHWPFCAAKCPYCDFNSHVRAERIDEDRFVAAFRAEIAHRAAQTPGRIVRSIFFGGGTPSLMRPQTVQAIIDAVAASWSIEPDAEITLEANPTSVEAGRFRGYRAAGVNRVSIGVQSLVEADLKALGRRHSVAEAIEAVKTGASIFPRTSFDLIYARPGQTEWAWRAELTEAMRIAGEHVSLYQLTIEPDTIFERLWRAGKLVTPDEELGRALFDATQEITEAHGLPSYEVSNHARPGAESRHNLIYWRYGAYAGVGPGAHGRLDLAGKRFATSCERLPERWRDLVSRTGHGITEMQEIAHADAAHEHLLMNMRLAEGLDLAGYESRWLARLDRERIATLESDGLVRLEAGKLNATTRGRLVLNSVIAALAD